MKALRLLFTIMLFAVMAWSFSYRAYAQDVTNLYMAGGSYSAGASPAVAGTALYAHAITISPDTFSGTYAFTLIDALPSTAKPFTVTTSIGAGFAQKVATVNKIAIFVPTAAGVTVNGSNVGWGWTTGAGAVFRISNHPAGQGDWFVMPTARVLKSSVGGAGYQPILGVLFGWGQ